MKGRRHDDTGPVEIAPVEITKPRSKGPICDFVCGAATAICAGLLITGSPFLILAGVIAYIAVLICVFLTYFVLKNLGGD